MITTGFHLGGSLAMVFAVRLHQRYRTKKHSLITFGQPRTGNRRLVDYINTNMTTLHRVVYSHDLQSTKPAAKWLFAAGIQLDNSTKFIHTKGLRVINQDGYCGYQPAKVKGVQKDQNYQLKESSGACIKSIQTYLAQHVGIKVDIF